MKRERDIGTSGIEPHMRWMGGLGFMFVVLSAPGCRGSQEHGMGSTEDNQRVGAYLAEPDAIDRAEFCLTDDWFTDTLPGVGITKLLLVAGPKEYSWRLERTYGESAPLTILRTLEDSNARSALQELCTELKNAGLAETPENMQDAGFGYFEAHRYSLELAIQGRYGNACMHWEFPIGLEITHHALDQLLARILRYPVLEKR